jgi:hypothetical protein
MVAELREERAIIDEAILALERIAVGQRKRRGRPPLWMSALKKPRKDSSEDGNTSSDDGAME